jgi:hypothetical protein
MEKRIRLTITVDRACQSFFVPYRYDENQRGVYNVMILKGIVVILLTVDSD